MDTDMLTLSDLEDTVLSIDPWMSPVFILEPILYLDILDSGSRDNIKYVL